MEINERKEKINLLQMKSKRNTIINEIEIKDIHLTLDSFLEPQHSYDLLGDLFNKIDKPVEYKEEFKFGHCKDKAAKELGILCRAASVCALCEACAMNVRNVIMNIA
ncbi:hypothetical protein LSPH24S_05910 [Lysinibacillus sphaericus]